MKKNSGEIMIGLLVGLLIGGIILAIDSNNEAQRVADKTGIATSPLDVIAEDPAGSTIAVVAPAIAGAGVGWVIDTLSGSNDNGDSRDNNVSVDGEDNNVSITIVGDQDNDSTTQDNDSTDNSFNK